VEVEAEPHQAFLARRHECSFAGTRPLEQMLPPPYRAATTKTDGDVGTAVAESVELQRSLGSPVKRKAEELYDNSFVNNLEKSGFQRELWGR